MGCTPQYTWPHHYHDMHCTVVVVCVQAVSCEAFCEALSAANPDHASLLSGLLPWYDTPGTPTLTISSSYSPSSESLTLTIKQNNHTAKEINKALHKPMLIPVKVGGTSGRADVYGLL